MKIISIVVFCILMPIFTSDGNKFNKDIVMAYSIPMDATYAIRVNENSIKTVSDCKIFKSDKNKLIKELKVFFTKNAGVVINEANSIDVRVLIEVYSNNNLQYSVAFDSNGNYKFKDEIYQKDEYLNCLIETYFPRINWMGK